jgi:endonuclease/exonuclease/phosphatase family metal-dependent hydrolase
MTGGQRREAAVRRVRLGSFNAKFLPGIVSDRTRARALASRIRRSDYDVIALQEVFDNGVRAVLLEELSDMFPSYVAYLKDESPFRVNSGLMVFSRLHFVDLPQDTRHRAARSQARNGAGRTHWHDVGFVRFRRAADSDRLAAKGAGMVRIDAWGRPLNLVFAHLQASYPRDRRNGRNTTKIAIRRDQLVQTASLVADALGPERAEREDVVFVGDFNVDGNVSNTGPAGGWRTNVDEYDQMIATLGAPFPKSGLIDVWRDLAPPDDPGFTYPNVQSAYRFDYVFWSPSSDDRPMTPEHVELAQNLRRLHPDRTDRIADLSDHVGINACFRLTGDTATAETRES